MEPPELYPGHSSQGVREESMFTCSLLSQWLQWAAFPLVKSRFMLDKKRRPIAQKVFELAVRTWSTQLPSWSAASEIHLQFLGVWLQEVTK